MHVMEVGSIQQGRDAFQITWTQLKGYVFPPFVLIALIG